MKNLIFNKELFDKNNYGKIFQDVVDALVRSGVIMSPEASMEVYKAIWEKASSTTAKAIDGDDLTFDEDLFANGWIELEKEL